MIILSSSSSSLLLWLQSSACREKKDTPFSFLLTLQHNYFADYPILSLLPSSSLIPPRGSILLYIISPFFSPIFLICPSTYFTFLTSQSTYPPLPCLALQLNSFTKSQHPQSLPTNHNPQATNSTSLLQVLQPSEHSVCLPPLELSSTHRWKRRIRLERISFPTTHCVLLLEDTSNQIYPPFVIIQQEELQSDRNANWTQHRPSCIRQSLFKWSKQHSQHSLISSSKSSRPRVKVARPDDSCSYRPGRSRSQKRKASASERTRSRIRDWKRAMIRRKPETPQSLYLSTPPPESSPRSSTVIADWDADDEETMSMEDIRSSRPPSLDDNIQSDGPYHPPRPTLPDVLSNSAPPPWTLSAFTAYLSQNHCLENLEFTMDAERYRKRYDALAAQLAGKPITANPEECRYVRMLWQRLINAYIMPDCPREINIPSSVRDRLLLLPNHSTPPQPEYLEAAVKIIYNLMEESVLISFLNEHPSSRTHHSHHSRPKPTDVKLR